MTNITLLVGNLGGDPELRSTNGDMDVASFGLGTSRVKRDSEGKTYKDESGFTAKDTEWHRITCFNGLGRIVAEHASKGMLVSVKGRSTTASGPTRMASTVTAPRSSPMTSSSCHRASPPATARKAPARVKLLHRPRFDEPRRQSRKTPEKKPISWMSVDVDGW